MYDYQYAAYNVFYVYENNNKVLRKRATSIRVMPFINKVCRQSYELKIINFKTWKFSHLLRPIYKLFHSFSYDI